MRKEKESMIHIRKQKINKADDMGWQFPQEKLRENREENTAFSKLKVEKAARSGGAHL